MSKNIKRAVAAYILGNIVQIILAVVDKVSWMDKPILFCAAAGFLVLVAIVAGMRLVIQDEKETRPKSYMDYANEQ